MCRALTTALTAGCTRLVVRDTHTTRPHFAALTAPLTHAAKTTHLMIAVSVIGSSVVHSAAHLANAVNFSRHFSKQFPELNVASYKDESPVRLVLTVPGVTGLLMLLILVVLAVSSLHWVRQRHYNFFYYTHHLGLVFFFLLLLHPLSGVLKEQKNVESHFPGCLMVADVHRVKDHHEPSTKRAHHLLSSAFQNIRRKEERDQHHRLKVQNHSEQKIYDITELEGYSNPEPEDYGYPEPSPDYGFPEPTPDYGFPKQSPDYGFPEPSPDYGFPEHSPDYGFPEPSPNYGFPEHSPDYGFPEPEPEPISRFYNNNDNNNLRLGIPQSTYAHVNRVRNASDTFKKKDQKFEMPYRTLMKKFLRRKVCLHQPKFGAMPSQTWVWVTIALVAWTLDWLLRWWRRRKAVVVVEVEYHPCKVMQLTLRKRGFKCSPGQYILLQCPELSRFEWHPFTVTYPPTHHSPDTFTIFIQERGDWSRHISSIFRQSLQPSPSIACPMSSVRNLHTPTHCKKENASSPLSSPSIACPMNSVRNHHTPAHCKKENASSPLSHSSQSLPNGLSLPSPYHQHPPAPFTSIPEHPNSSPQSACRVTDKSLSYGLSSSNLSSAEPWEQCSSNSKASHIHPIYHSLEPDSYKHISHSIKSLEYSRSEQSCDPESNNGVNISSTLNYEPHFTRRKSKRREEREGTAADRKTVIHLLRPSNVRLYVDGPFSSPSEGMLQYPVVVGAAGGMGITPLAATLTHILRCRSSWPRRVHVVWAVRDARLLHTFAPLLSGLLQLCWETKTEDRAELSLHLTYDTQPQLLQNLFAKDHPALLPRIQHGRPQWKHLFLEWQRSYVGQTVGVFACGPPKLRHQVKRHCLSAVSRGAAFHYHQESFS
ncbi:NADPH oxidase 4-like isoform X2 [Eriocheir sinensis]|nr:NADPH oxidase 4-like isoform X2 [Eriocheir sinensis]